MQINCLAYFNASGFFFSNLQVYLIYFALLEAQ